MAEGNTASGRRQREIRQSRDDSGTEANTMDYTLYLIAVVLTMFGVLMVFSSSYLTAATEEAFNYDSLYFLKRNGLLAAGGFLLMNFLIRFDHKIIYKFSFLIFIVTIGLLIIVMYYGITSGGATRWIPMPVIGRFQPSEVAKAAIIFTLAAILHRNPVFVYDIGGFLKALLLTGIMAGLVFFGGLSSALITALIGFCMIFIASPHLLRFIFLGLTGAGSMLFYLWYSANFTEGYRGGRFNAWLDPFADPTGDGFQIVQSLYAIASGGLFGIGIGQSRQKTFIPEVHNDMIFSIICEELGLVGAALILLLFGIFIWRGIRIALNAPTVFSSMTAAGIVLSIAFQVIINVGVVTNTIPNTGVTLPFISYGGTSLLVCMAMTGVLLNISKHSGGK